MQIARARPLPAEEDLIPYDQAAGLALLAFGGAVPLVFWVRRRRRTCGACRVPMRQLLGDDEEVNLDPGERVERQLGSAQHEIWRCDRCAETRRFRHARWFSGYGACRRCHRRAVIAHATVERAATVYAGGLLRHERTCESCGENAVRLEHTAALPTVFVGNDSFPVAAAASSASGFGGDYGGGSASGGDAGGDGFDGGTSGGGGAGSSW